MPLKSLRNESKVEVGGNLFLVPTTSGERRNFSDRVENETRTTIEAIRKLTVHGDREFLTRLRTLKVCRPARLFRCDGGANLVAPADQDKRRGFARRRQCCGSRRRKDMRDARCRSTNCLRWLVVPRPETHGVSTVFRAQIWQASRTETARWRWIRAYKDGVGG